MSLKQKVPPKKSSDAVETEGEKRGRERRDLGVYTAKKKRN